METAAPGIARFLRFVALSGAGWCLDLALFVALAGPLTPGLANVASSLIAASLVFLASRRAVFDRAEGRVPMRLAGYALYTLLLILLAARGIAHLVPALRAAGCAPLAAAILAKIAVTPPQMLLNFLVARLLAERAFGVRHG